VVTPEQSSGVEHLRSVLVVEDDAFIRGLIAEYLSKAGFAVTQASNAAEASRLIHLIDPDALVLDIDLGAGPSGIDLVKGLNLNSNEIGIVFLTNFSDPRFAGHETDSAKPNAAYLNKHMLDSPMVLLDALNAVLAETGIELYRFDKREDRPMAHLSYSQIQVLRLIADGKTNAQIAGIRDRSLGATESLITRTLSALGISQAGDLNARVVAAREFIMQINDPRRRD
jgi:DNA-binding NarL/FixJ family response regulator